MKKEIVIILLCLAIIFMLVNKTKNKFIYVNNDKLNICQKCAIINDNYYCQVYGMESDK